MITATDILDMCALTRDEIDAIALHEHLGEVDAAMLAEYDLHRPHGPQHIHTMIAEDIRTALHADNLPRARALYRVLHHFLSEHPEAVRGAEG